MFSEQEWKWNGGASKEIMIFVLGEDVLKLGIYLEWLIKGDEMYSLSLNLANVNLLFTFMEVITIFVCLL